MNRRSGISILDVVIILLIVGVIAALVIPKARMEKKEQATIACREQQLAISEAMMRFYTTAGDTSLLTLHEKPVEPETTEVATEPAPKGKQPAEVVDTTTPPPRLFTEDTTLLRPYLDPKYSFKCPLDGQEYIVIARDSIFYSISCQNDGHGQVIRGRATWEE